MTTLVVTDLDGTLWDNSLQCTAAVAATIVDLRADPEVTLLAATGRRRNSARRAFEGNGFVLPSVLLNGAIGYDFDDHVIFHQVSFGGPDLVAVIEVLERYGIAPVAYLADTRALAVEGVTTSGKHLESLGDDLVWSTYEELARSGHVLGMSMLGIDYETVRPALEALEGDARAEVAGFADHLYPPFSFMIAPPDITKVVGIDAYCRHAEIEPDRVVALGDGGNDLAMLAMADVALVVEGADPRALDLADAVIPGPSAGGWAQVVDYL